MPRYRYHIDRRSLSYDPSDEELAELFNAYGDKGLRLVAFELTTIGALDKTELMAVLEETITWSSRFTS